jgi:elongation factor 1-gamma
VAAYFQRAVPTSFETFTHINFPHLIRHRDVVTNQPKLKDTFATEHDEKALQGVSSWIHKKPNPVLFPAFITETKRKVPLDDTPNPTFNLEDWKRAYSKMETRGPGGALEWFYRKCVWPFFSHTCHEVKKNLGSFDSHRFSIWRVDFKYNEELVWTLWSIDQIRRFFKLLEASSPYLFGIMGVLGEDHNNIISGIFILRGQDAKAVVNVATVREMYAFTKLDLNDEAQKAFFEGALARDLEHDGRKWIDGKTVSGLFFLLNC